MCKRNSCLASLAIIWIAFISTLVVLPATAALETTVANTIKSNLNNAMTALQSGNATQAQQLIILANNTLNNQICEMPICNIPGGFVRSSEADTSQSIISTTYNAKQLTF